MAYETLIVETTDAVTLIRLNRPEALNALNSQLLSELTTALDQAEADDGVRCLVLTGSDRAFAAGADIKEMSDKTYAQMFSQDFFGAFARRMEQFRKPIIAAVSGYALGGGCELAMLCDFIIAAESAKFGQPEINLGVAPGIGGTQRLTRFVGKSKAMDMILTARMMDAAEAERSGLVSRVVAADKLIEEAMAAATKIAGQSPLAVMMNKELVEAAYETTLSTGVALERRLFHSLFAFDDQKEGMAAFVEKRKPNFKGS
ncbi:enoyl-CoA hydratase [Phenylobacterium sp.]|uniref:enoyl-CoA hydratase n=1 Tax=Phenylobacterium sp. TaxID=1871053 RepID=UPI002716C6C0|nr:enoyl-CoA hydratase [Phenylobacterium sp.]MDO8798884.1 enoyl-CoA hydratase [Phenylobacterium sp.]